MKVVKINEIDDGVYDVFSTHPGSKKHRHLRHIVTNPSDKRRTFTLPKEGASILFV